MKFVLISLTGLLLPASAALAQYAPTPAPVPPPDQPPAGVCEIRPDAPYINPRLPLGRAAYAHRPACRTTWAQGTAGPGVYVQGPPVEVEGPPVSVGGLTIYLVPPEIVVRPSEVTVDPPQVHSAPTATADGVSEPAD